MTPDELRAVAAALDLVTDDDTERIRQNILEAQSKYLQTTGRRQRIVRKEVNHVFSSEKKPAARKGKDKNEGATETIMVPKFGLSQNIRKLEVAQAALSVMAKDGTLVGDDNEAPAKGDENVAQATETQVPEPPKRKRGRPSKAEIAAREAMMLQNSQEAAAQTAQAETDSAEKEQEGGAARDFAAAEQDSSQDFAQIAEQSLEQDQADEQLELPETSDDIEPIMDDAAVPETLETDAPDEEEEESYYETDEDFIITRDIPVLPPEELVLEAVAERNTPASAPEYQPQQEPVAEIPKFRRFKDDLDVQRNLSANTAATTSAAANRPYALQAETISRYAYRDIILDGGGVLEMANEGFGYLRSADYNYLASPDDIYVSNLMVKQYGLRPGDVVEGRVRVPKDGEKYYILVEVQTINGVTPEICRGRLAFEHLTPLFPDEQFKLSGGKNTNHACRIVDLFAPIGKGQRALIVAQPKTGKTMLLKDIANAIAENYPDTYLMMLLIDERPEEVTDMARTVKAEVIASTFDEPAARHVKIAGIVLEKAKRMVECGHDVVIFLDSITRLARAYNTVAPASGKILSGGVDANALQKPKRFFGAARNVEGGGSLTIIATALIDTGSRMDEVIFEEFKGTGNMELQLDRSLANKRVFPAVNLTASSTRRDDLLQDANTINRMFVVRNHLAEMTTVESMEFMKKQMENTRDNEEFLMSISN